MQVEESNQQQRKKLLTQALAHVGLQIRSGSKLCEAYIKGSTRMKLDQIVQCMAKARLFREFCDWSYFYSHSVKEQEEVLEAGYFPDCSLVQETEDFLQGLSKDWDRYQWPWLVGESVAKFQTRPEYQRLYNAKRSPSL
jgi:hypothetical protein